MNLRTLARHGFGAILTVTALGLGAGSAHAGTFVSTPTPVDPLSDCSHGAFSQPLLGFKDRNLYTLAPGGNFEGPTSWELIRGASCGYPISALGHLSRSQNFTCRRISHAKLSFSCSTNGSALRSSEPSGFQMGSSTSGSR